MKLLYITNGINGSGGLERVLSVKASALTEDYGYEVVIATLNEPEHRPFYTFSPKVQFKNFVAGGNPLMYFMQYRQQLRKLVKEVQPDIISVCDDGLKGFFIPKILGKRIPIIYERHVSQNIYRAQRNEGLGNWITEKTFALMRRLSHDFDAFVVLTQGSLTEWPANAKTQVIPNPLPFYPEETAALTKKKVIAVGKQSYQKAYDLLLPIWKQTVRPPGWELHIFGKLAQELKLDELRKELGLEDSVFFHPPSNDIEKEYRDASVFVLTSRFEGFGMVLIEAMACGLPVVSFDCPHGPGDIISDGEDGFLIENGNTDLFVAKLSELLKNKELRIKMGAKSRENVQTYLPAQIVRQWDAILMDLKKNQMK